MSGRGQRRLNATQPLGVVFNNQALFRTYDDIEKNFNEYNALYLENISDEYLRMALLRRIANICHARILYLIEEADPISAEQIKAKAREFKVGDKELDHKWQEILGYHPKQAEFFAKATPHANVSRVQDEESEVVEFLLSELHRVETWQDFVYEVEKAASILSVLSLDDQQRSRIENILASKTAEFSENLPAVEQEQLYEYLFYAPMPDAKLDTAWQTRLAGIKNRSFPRPDL